jgi:hypothetical protein
LKDQLAESSGGAEGARQRTLSESSVRAFDIGASPVEERIVVEASPAEIERIVAACVADTDYFATTARDRHEVEQLGANRGAAEAPALGKSASVSGGAYGFGGGGRNGDKEAKNEKAPAALGAASDAAKGPDAKGKELLAARRAGGKQSGGLAWRLPPMANDDASSINGEASEKAKQGEDVRLRAKGEISSAAGPTGAATRADAPMSLKQAAKEPEQPAKDTVRVVFVLRHAASSAAATATPTAAPAETTPAKPR